MAGLPAGLAGSVLMVVRIFDAINDPIIGMWSDRTRTIWGRRLPWMLLGSIPFGISYFLLWLIPTNNQLWLFLYYIFIGIIFNLTYTVVNLPYQALTPELELYQKVVAVGQCESLKSVCQDRRFVTILAPLQLYN